MQALEAQGALVDQATRERLARSFPGQAAGWMAAAKLGACEEAAYWRAVSICVWQDTPAEEVQTAVSRLLEAGRPRSAFKTAHLLPDKLPAAFWEKVHPPRLMRATEPRRNPAKSELSQPLDAEVGSTGMTSAVKVPPPEYRIVTKSGPRS